MNYCSQCGAPLGTIREGGRERPACPACGHVVYRNALPVAMAVPRMRGQILLVQRRTPPLRGFWAPPGGYVEADESVHAAAVRETLEETGVTITLGDLAGLYSGAGLVLVTFWGEVTGGDPTCGDDAADVALFPPDALPLAPLVQTEHPLDVWFHAVLQDLYTRVGRGEGAPAGRRRPASHPLSLHPEVCRPCNP